MQRHSRKWTSVKRTSVRFYSGRRSCCNQGVPPISTGKNSHKCSRPASRRSSSDRSIWMQQPPWKPTPGNDLIKVAVGVSLQFFFIWTRVLNNNQYVEIKQFSKVEIKQSNISTVIKFFVYQWDPRHLQGSRFFLHIYLHFIFVFYLISNHIFVSINHKYMF